MKRAGARGMTEPLATVRTEVQIKDILTQEMISGNSGRVCGVVSGEEGAEVL